MKMTMTIVWRIPRNVRAQETFANVFLQQCVVLEPAHGAQTTCICVCVAKPHTFSTKAGKHCIRCMKHLYGNDEP